MVPVILIVDDLENDIFFIRNSLERAKIYCVVQSVTSGEEARNYLSGNGKYSNREEYPLPNLVLLDLKMPGLDGFELLRWIRQQPGFNMLRVVVLTSSDQIEDVNEASQLGANSFLTKPQDFFDYVQLSRFISDYWLKLDKAPEATRPRQNYQAPN